MLPHTSALRYVTPFREGGSLPGLVEAADDGMYVVKFTGAGQGPKVLVAEVIVAGLARALGLRTPDLVTIELPAPPAQDQLWKLYIWGAGDFGANLRGIPAQVRLP